MVRLEDFMEKWYCGYAIVQKLKGLYPEVFDHKHKDNDDPIATVMAHRGVGWMTLPGGPIIQKEAKGRHRWVITVYDFNDFDEILEELRLDIYDVVAPNGVK